MSTANVDAIKIGEMVMTWFLINYSDREIMSFGAQFKTQMLGAPGSLTKHQRKKWAIEKAKEIFEQRGDEEALEMMTKGKKAGQKQDDVADACVQCQAFKFRHMVGLF